MGRERFDVRVKGEGISKAWREATKWLVVVRRGRNSIDAAAATTASIHAAQYARGFRSFS